MLNILKELTMNYDFLNSISPPNIIKHALRHLGLKEGAGPLNNKIILNWGAECGINYTDDSIPWCGLFAAVVCKRANWDLPKDPLWARNWSKFGKKVKTPGLGDVLVFERGEGGHVGFYIAEDETTYHVLGGNQGDAVSIKRIDKARLLSANRPKWKLAQPESVKQYFISNNGEISTNEA